VFVSSLSRTRRRLHISADPIPADSIPAFSEGEGRDPAEGKGRDPAEGDGRYPAEGDGRYPAEGKGRDPAEGKGRDPAEGDGRYPAEGGGRQLVEGLLVGSFSADLPVASLSNNPLKRGEADHV
jgi:hypothetical protein